jgi:hypothetical protein
MTGRVTFANYRISSSALWKCRYVGKEWRQRVDLFFEEIVAEFELTLARDTASLKM